MGWLYSKAVGSIWGSTPVEEPILEEYVSVEFLDRQADQLLKWAAKIENPLHSEASLKRQLRKVTEHSEQDIDMLLVHMKHSGRMEVEALGEGPDLLLCKLKSPTQKKCDPI
jgi:hypothetical protein